MTAAVLKVIESLIKRDFNPKETMQILTNNQPIWWSWGATKRVNFNNKALVIKVNAHRHKGYLVIALDWMDTYEVSLVLTSGKLVKTLENIYFDELVSRIDEEIEKIPEYSS